LPVTFKAKLETGILDQHGMMFTNCVPLNTTLNAACIVNIVNIRPISSTEMVEGHWFLHRQCPGAHCRHFDENAGEAQHPGASSSHLLTRSDTCRLYLIIGERAPGWHRHGQEFAFTNKSNRPEIQ
jgi:hypothetical protein